MESTLAANNGPAVRDVTWDEVVLSTPCEEGLRAAWGWMLSEGKRNPQVRSAIMRFANSHRDPHWDHRKYFQPPTQ